MDKRTKDQIDATLLQESNAQLREALEILGAGDTESLKDVATRRMWQAMPDAMRMKQQENTAH